MSDDALRNELYKIKPKMTEYLRTSHIYEYVHVRVCINYQRSGIFEIHCEAKIWFHI